MKEPLTEQEQITFRSGMRLLLMGWTNLLYFGDYFASFFYCFVKSWTKRKKKVKLLTFLTFQINPCLQHPRDQTIDHGGFKKIGQHDQMYDYGTNKN